MFRLTDFMTGATTFYIQRAGSLSENGGDIKGISSLEHGCDSCDYRYCKISYLGYESVWPRFRKN